MHGRDQVRGPLSARDRNPGIGGGALPGRAPHLSGVAPRSPAAAAGGPRRGPVVPRGTADGHLDQLPAGTTPDLGPRRAAAGLVEGPVVRLGALHRARAPPAGEGGRPGDPPAAVDRPAAAPAGIDVVLVATGHAGHEHAVAVLVADEPGVAAALLQQQLARQAVQRSRNQWWFGSSGVNSSRSSRGSGVRVWVTRRGRSSESQAGHRAVRTDRPGSGRSRTKAKKAGRVVYSWSIGPPPFGRGSGVMNRPHSSGAACR